MRPHFWFKAGSRNTYLSCLTYLGKIFNCPTCRTRVHAKEIVKLFTNHTRSADEGHETSKLRDQFEAYKVETQARLEANAQEILELKEALLREKRMTRNLSLIAAERERLLAGVLNLRQDDSSASPIHPGQVRPKNFSVFSLHTKSSCSH